VKNCTFAWALIALCLGTTALAPAQEHVKAIAAPSSPLPAEADSKTITKFSFIAYGATLGRRDGKEIQYEHSLIVDSMLAQIKKLQTSEFPIRFILQSGDAPTERIPSNGASVLDPSSTVSRRKAACRIFWSPETMRRPRRKRG
jgi:hypothetical protein